MHLCESWMKNTGKQLTLGFSSNFSQSECSIHIAWACTFHVFYSLYWLFITCFIILLMLWWFSCCGLFFFNCWQRAFFFPPKEISVKQGKMDCPVIPGDHISSRSSGCLLLLVMNPATVAKTVNHIGINCKIGPVIILSLALPRNKSKKI